jgi:isopropylmalate/homocitrate/citramalate synthase
MANMQFEPFAAPLRRQFPFHAVPRTVLEAEEPAMQPAPMRTITDTTFRDGQQARVPFSPEQILALFDLLHQLDHHAGLIRQSEFFIYAPSERATVERCLARGYRFPEVTAWIRAREEDIRLVQGLGLAETGILTSVSDLHVTRKLGWSREEALRRYLAIVDEVLARGIRPRCHFEDVTRADVHGFVVPFAVALMERARAAGLPVKIRLCDTMGVALPWPAAALPRGVPKLIRALIDGAGVPPEWLEWHGHNDFFKAEINAATAWLYGCSAVNTTLLGLGERSGNTALEGVLVEHLGLPPDTRDPRLQPDLQLLPRIAQYLQEHCGCTLPGNHPLLGSEAYCTRAGVHIDGLLKDPETYLSFDPQEVLGSPIRVIVSDRSGAAGIAWWVNERRARQGRPPVAKSDPGIQRVAQALRTRYECGRTDDPGDAELTKLVTAHAPELLLEPTKSGARTAE